MKSRYSSSLTPLPMLILVFLAACSQPKTTPSSPASTPLALQIQVNPQVGDGEGLQADLESALRTRFGARIREEVPGRATPVLHLDVKRYKAKGSMNPGWGWAGGGVSGIGIGANISHGTGWFAGAAGTAVAILTGVPLLTTAVIVSTIKTDADQHRGYALHRFSVDAYVSGDPALHLNKTYTAWRLRNEAPVLNEADANDPAKVRAACAQAIAAAIEKDLNQ